MSQSGDHLRAGQLEHGGPDGVDGRQHRARIDFYFAFGVIAVTAGVAAPFTILAGAVAVASSPSQWPSSPKAEPSAGSFITYIETSLGPRAGVATALLSR